MRKIKKIYYITYQTFPSEKANTIQTISNIKYFVKAGLDVSLFFPLREKQSNSNLKSIQNLYSIDEEFNVFGLKHNLPFGRFNFLNSFFFLVSHFLWSRKTVKTVLQHNTLPDIFFTRSDWVFYFLSKQKMHVIFECHQYSKLRLFLLKKSLKNPASKIVFLNENLYEDFQHKDLLSNNFSVIHNGVDLELFNKVITKKDKEIIFVGSMKRFNESRDLDFIIDSILKIKKGYNLTILGATSSEISEMKRKYPDVGFNTHINILGRLSRSETIERMKHAEIGLLINSNTNPHSVKYTSPLKYFEYLGAGLKVLAVDFDSHRRLPFSDNITFFNNNDFLSFEESLNKANDSKKDISINKDFISLENRVVKILKLAVI
jgi:glycosyltransferase involved in cell wall biosynthesis